MQAPARPSPAVAALDVNAVRARVRNETTRLGCAGVQAQVADDREVTVQGFVQSADDRAALDRALSAIPGVGRVQMRLAIHPWPVCEARQMADGIAAANVRIMPNRADATYRIDRDALSWRLLPDPGVTGYVMLAIINSDGSVTQPTEWSRMPVRGGQPLRFLEPDGVPIGPPAGQMALLAVVSPQPLFAQQRPDEERAQAFFAAVRQAIAAQSGVIGAIAVIETTR